MDFHRKQFISLPSESFGGQIAFDVIVIGAGPGGYVCAHPPPNWSAGKSACIDKESRFGGTSHLSSGTIPSRPSSMPPKNSTSPSTISQKWESPSTTPASISPP